jgi:hypothetical protein
MEQYNEKKRIVLHMLGADGLERLFVLPKGLSYSDIDSALDEYKLRDYKLLNWRYENIYIL